MCTFNAYTSTFKALSKYNSYQTESSLFVFCQIFQAHLKKEISKSSSDCTFYNQRNYHVIVIKSVVVWIEERLYPRQTRH